MWRPLRSRRSLIVIGLLLVLGYLAYGHPARSRGGSSHGWASGKGSTSSWSVGGWKFNANRDRDNHSLTPEQCDVTFPKLYHEIDRARDYWRQAQGGANLTPNQLDLDWSFDGGLRGMIYDNQARGPRAKPRANSSLTCPPALHNLLPRPEPFPALGRALESDSRRNQPRDPRLALPHTKHRIHDQDQRQDRPDSRPDGEDRLGLLAQHLRPGHGSSLGDPRFQLLGVPTSSRELWLVPAGKHGDRT